MNRLTRYSVGLAILAASTTIPGYANTVTFDDPAGQKQTGGYYPGESFSDQGLTFTYSPQGSAFMYLWDSSSLGPAPGSNGTNVLLVGATASGSDYVTITSTTGGLFTISSLLLGINEGAHNQTSDFVLINGLRQNITDTATEYNFDSLNDVSSVNISGLAGGGYVAIDNINFQYPTTLAATPEPGSLLLLGSGLFGCLFVRFRRSPSHQL